MRILLRIVGMAGRYRLRLFLSYLTLLASVAATLALPRILGHAVDGIVAGASRQALIGMALTLLVVSVLRGLADFARIFFADSTSQKVTYDLRNALYDAWQHLSFGYHDKEHTGDLMSRATADVESVRRFINLGMLRSVHMALMMVVICILMVRLDWKLALLSLSFLPFMVLRSTMVVYSLRRAWSRVQQLTGELVTALQENLSGMAVVKAFAAERFEEKKFAARTRELADSSFRADRIEAGNNAAITFFFTLATGLILWYGGRQVIQTDLTLGQFTEFIFLMSMLNQPIRMSAWIINTYARAISAGERVFQVLDAQSPVRDLPGARPLEHAAGRVDFDHVSFTYGAASPVLKDVDIHARPGQITAILGAPGSGKSTIVHLLPRFYDATDGAVRIDGVDVREFTLDSLRRNVGIVAQDVFLFAATIRENIAYGVANATQEDVVRAAKVAQLHDFIMSLPDGYETWVGERGATLSGGQRQRMAIARTILLDPPILILDDSTSSVDVETERQIRQAMQEVVRGRTTFIIAHRLSTVRHADHIMVMRDGVIAEQGTHDELYAMNGLYRNIYELQLRPQEEVLLEATLPAVSAGGNA
ncbi:MAG: ABC transporter ATP-binding protein [SAR202 cluster bacterium]|nr:ABC transporter ATP-binding protein [SAR202 cluster bacterium]